MGLFSSCCSFNAPPLQACAKITILECGSFMCYAAAVFAFILSRKGKNSTAM